jgi:adenylate cyclase
MVAEHDVLTELRGGLAAGGLIRGYGDFYGPEVNRAARIVQLAEPGMILVSESVRELAGADGGYRFDPAGTRDLAGFEEPTAVFALERA